MSSSRRGMLALATVILLALTGTSLLYRKTSAPDGIEVTDVVAPDPDDKPLAVRLWYPKLDKRGLPLIVISHGTGGNDKSHEDTAVALAEAGFVVAAVTHTGDNTHDDSYVGKGLHLVGRPRHVSRVIDYMLNRWAQRERINPARIGLLGHSAGGFTGLVAAGGEPDMSLGRKRCRRRPEAWDCRYLKEHGLDVVSLDDRPAPMRWHHDPRIRSAVIAAPAVGYSFAPDHLAEVRVPLQLWEAEHDSIVEDSPAVIAGLLPQPPDRHIVGGAGHFSFLAPCDWRMRAIIALVSIRGTPDICADPAGFDRGTFHQRFNGDVIAFFGRTLATVD